MGLGSGLGGGLMGGDGIQPGFGSMQGTLNNGSQSMANQKAKKKIGGKCRI